MGKKKIWHKGAAFFLHRLHRHADLLIKVNSLLSDVHVLAIVQDPGLPGGDLGLVGAFQKAMEEHGLSGHQVGPSQHLLSAPPCALWVFPKLHSLQMCFLQHANTLQVIAQKLSMPSASIC